jgi:hypothetical protein
MKRSTALLAVISLFLVGALVGVLGTHLFYLRHLREPGWLVKTGSRLLAADLRRQLDLTPEQQRQLDSILLDTQKDVRAVRREMMPRMLAVLDRSQSRIEGILTPEQRETFRRLRERRGDRLRGILTGG